MQKNSYLDQWNIVGPFDYDRNKILSRQKYGPEEGPLDLSASYKGARGRNVRWRKAKADEDNIISLKKYFRRRGSKLAYAVTYLYSEREGEVVLKIDSDDGRKLWLNGETIYSMNRAPLRISPQPKAVKVTLKRGRNTLLFKISDSGNKWAFKMSIESSYPIKEAYSK